LLLPAILKPSCLVVIVAVLLTAVHSHVTEHEVPHPLSAKVSVAVSVVPVSHLPLNPAAAVAVFAAEHLIAIGIVDTVTTLALPETEQSSFGTRGPPSVCLLYAG
jgi:hypothetical protein